MLSGVFDLIPDEVARTVTDLPEPKVVTGTRKESEMDCTPAATAIISKQAQKCFRVDPEVPGAFVLRPKKTRAEDSKYTRWVKTRPCCGCGARSDDPHHIIGHGQGGMGTKAHDFSLSRCAVNATTHYTRIWRLGKRNMEARLNCCLSSWISPSASGLSHEDVPDNANP